MQWAIMQICKLCMMSRVHNSVRYEHRTLVNIANNLHMYMTLEFRINKHAAVHAYVFVFDFNLTTYLLRANK